MGGEAAPCRTIGSERCADRQVRVAHSTYTRKGATYAPRQGELEELAFSYSARWLLPVKLASREPLAPVHLLRVSIAECM